MHSLRTRITLLTVCVIAFAVIVVTLLSVLFIRNNERRESEQMLLLLCETGERNLDYYFNSVQKSVEKMAAFAEGDITGLGAEELDSHIHRAEDYFEVMASKTNGVLTYYYRIDPEISDTVKGFWYTDLKGEGFTPHEVTDITLYDTQDTSKLVAALYHGSPGCAGDLLQRAHLLAGTVRGSGGHRDRLFHHGEAGGEHPALQ